MSPMKWIAWTSGILAMAILATVACIRLQPAPSREWKEFAIGPAAGVSVLINPGVIRGDGASLLTLLAWVHRLPAVRVIGPELLQTRFALVAAVYDEDPETLRSMLDRELVSRFHLKTHMESRAFDVLVLTSTARPALAPVTNSQSSTSILGRSVKLTGSPIGNLAGALQSVLGRPVVDETGMQGKYTLELVWGEDREESIVAALREKFGLLLTPGARNLEALVVDRIQPGMAMAIFSGIDRVARFAPPGLRHSISRALTIR
jgi:uncharacterized protein (TIGR03435 family)